MLKMDEFYSIAFGIRILWMVTMPNLDVNLDVDFPGLDILNGSMLSITFSNRVAVRDVDRFRLDRVAFSLYVIHVIP